LSINLKEEKLQENTQGKIIDPRTRGKREDTTRSEKGNHHQLRGKSAFSKGLSETIREFKIPVLASRLREEETASGHKKGLYVNKSAVEPERTTQQSHKKKERSRERNRSLPFPGRNQKFHPELRGKKRNRSASGPEKNHKKKEREDRRGQRKGDESASHQRGRVRLCLSRDTSLKVPEAGRKVNDKKWKKKRWGGSSSKNKVTAIYSLREQAVIKKPFSSVDSPTAQKGERRIHK